MTPTSMKGKVSRHVHRNATDKDGKAFFVVMVVWIHEKAMSIRCWSVDGKAENPHRYFPKRPIEDYGRVQGFLAEHGLTVEAKDIEIPSTKWQELSNLRSVKVVRETTLKEKDGYVNTTTYLQPWFGWEHTVVTVPCLSKQIAVEEGYKERDSVFTSCSMLLKDHKASVAAKLISASW